MQQSAKTNLNVEEVFFSIARDIKQRLSDTDTKQEVKYYCVAIIEELSTSWLCSGIVLGSTDRYSHVDLQQTKICTSLPCLTMPKLPLIYFIVTYIRHGEERGVPHQTSLAGPLTYINFSYS